jgi:hypothetical protein
MAHPSVILSYFGNDLRPIYTTIHNFIKCIPDEAKYAMHTNILSMLFTILAKNEYELTIDQLKEVSNELIKKGFNVNYTLTEPEYLLYGSDDFIGHSSASFAIRYSNIDYLDWLLEHGVKIIQDNLIDLYSMVYINNDPLNVFEDKFRRALTILLEHGVDINKPYTFTKDGDATINQSILRHLIEDDNEDTVQRAIQILEEKGADRGQARGGRRHRHDRRRATRVKRAKRSTRRRKV